jgi:myo-inositol 2-dehydrogenase/D-chiro-inositol 1-dehydrogenase
MIRIAVLGVGRIGRMHAENIANHPRARLAGVYDVIDAAAQEVSSKLGVHAFRSVDEVLASPEVDAILIATSTPTHADLIEKAIAAGKPMLCEKPIDLWLDPDHGSRVNDSSWGHSGLASWQARPGV